MIETDEQWAERMGKILAATPSDNERKVTMPIKLTDEDRAAALAAWNAEAQDVTQNHDPQHTANCMYAVYRAGMRAMAERAAKVCEETYPEFRHPDRILRLLRYSNPSDCAAAIRKLIAE